MARDVVRFMKWVIAVGGLILSLGSIGCESEPTAPRRSYPYVYPIDASPTWSADGQWIAFHRRQAGLGSPPGLYIVPVGGGTIRYVASGDFFWPEEISIGPDNKQIVFVSGQQLMMADVMAKTQWPVVYTDYGVSYADWSASGRYIAYRRLLYSSLTLPDVDSSGLHVLDLVTGEDRALRAMPPGDQLPVYFAIDPRWSRDETEIAFIQGRSDGYNIVTVGKDGSNYRVLNQSPTNTSYDCLRAYVRPTHFLDGFLFWQTNGPEGGPKFVSRRSGQVRSFDRFRTISDAFSPDGEWLVTVGIDPQDTAEVLFVERVDDRLGLEKRQLTTWTRAPGTPAIALDEREYSRRLSVMDNLRRNGMPRR